MKSKNYIWRNAFFTNERMSNIKTAFISLYSYFVFLCDIRLNRIDMRSLKAKTATCS